MSTLAYLHVWVDIRVWAAQRMQGFFFETEASSAMWVHTVTDLVMNANQQFMGTTIVYACLSSQNGRSQTTCNFTKIRHCTAVLAGGHPAQFADNQTMEHSMCAVAAGIYDAVSLHSVSDSLNSIFKDAHKSVAKWHCLCASWGNRWNLCSQRLSSLWAICIRTRTVRLRFTTMVSTSARHCKHRRPLPGGGGRHSKTHQKSDFTVSIDECSVKEAPAHRCSA